MNDSRFLLTQSQITIQFFPKTDIINEYITAPAKHALYGHLVSKMQICN